MAKSKQKPTARETPKGNWNDRDDQTASCEQVYYAPEQVTVSPAAESCTLKDSVDAHLDALLRTISIIRAELGGEFPTRKIDSEKVGLACTPSKPSSDELKLSFAQRCVFDCVDAVPRRGPEIAVRAGYTYDSVRHHLSLLKKLGLIEHDNRGYFRI